MKNLITTLGFLIMSFLATAQTSVDPQAEALGTITITLTGLQSDEGQLMVALYASDANWLNKNYKGTVTEIVDGAATVTFEDVPYGSYAVSSFHDENSNDKLDTGLFGIPKEPYACSKGAKGMFGPPKWEDAKFEVNTQLIDQAVKF